MEIKVTLETQNGRSLLIGTYASLTEASKAVKVLDAEWERGDRLTELLAAWEGSDVYATEANPVGDSFIGNWILAGDGPDEEEWSEI